MKFIVDGEEVLDLNPTKKKVLMNDLNADQVDADLKRRVAYVINHKYEQCMKRLKAEWEPKLKAKGMKTIPLDDDALADLIFKQPEYKDRKQRDQDV